MNSYFSLDEATAYIYHLKQEEDYFVYFMHINVMYIFILYIFCT